MNEKLDLILRGLKNLPAVVEGFSNSFLDKFNLLSEEDKILAYQRLEICKKCPFNSENAKNIGYKTEFNDLHCSICKCKVDKKVFAFDENCGLDYFIHNPLDPSYKHILEYYRNNNEEIKLKWNKKK